MTYARFWTRFFTTKTTSTVTSFCFKRHHQFLPKYASFFRKAEVSQTMKRCMSTTASLPYHVHKVTISQESILTKGRMIEFEISVIDTHSDGSDKPTVVGVHGIPGSAVNFEPCIEKLAEKNVRFIGPTFPGFEGSDVESWKLYHLDYSSVGCASVVVQVLDHLRIDRVSTIMGHSAGSWTSYRLAAELDRVKSLCLLNPVGARPHRALRPHAVIHFLAWLMRFQSLHFFMMPLLEFGYSLVGFSGIKGGDHLMAAQQLLSCQNFDHTKQHAEQIRKKRLPLLFAYTLNDKIIEQSVYEEMLFQHLNVPKSSVTKFDRERNQTPFSGTSVDEAPRTAPYTCGLQFERGGHVAHKAYNQIVMDRVLQLLDHAERRQPWME